MKSLYLVAPRQAAFVVRPENRTRVELQSYNFRTVEALQLGLQQIIFDLDRQNLTMWCVLKPRMSREALDTFEKYGFKRTNQASPQAPTTLTRYPANINDDTGFAIKPLRVDPRNEDVYHDAKSDNTATHYAVVNKYGQRLNIYDSYSQAQRQL